MRPKRFAVVAVVVLAISVLATFIWGIGSICWGGRVIHPATLEGHRFQWELIETTGGTRHAYILLDTHTGNRYVGFKSVGAGGLTILLEGKAE